MQAVRLPSERWTAGLTGSGHGNLELPSCSQRLWKRMGSRGRVFPSLKGGKCSPHFWVSTANRSPAKSSKQTPEMLWHQQPAGCEIAGEKGRKRRSLDALCGAKLLPPSRNRLNIYFLR